MLQKLKRHFQRYFPKYVCGISAIMGFGIIVAGVLSGLPETVLWLGWLATLLLVGGLYKLWLCNLPKLARQLGSRDMGKRMAAFQLLLKMGKHAVPIFVQVLSAPCGENTTVDWDGDAARRLAVEGLGQLKAKEAVEVLVELLDDHDEKVRHKAMWALGEIGGERAVSALIPLLGVTKEFRDSAAFNLRKLGKGELVDAFFCVLWHRDEKALANLRGQHRQEIAEAFLRSLESLWSTAPNAAWALGELMAMETLQKLRAIAQSHPSQEVREACQQAIGKLEPLSKLPRSVEGVQPDIATLPRPASASEIGKDTLPRPAEFQP